MRLTGKRDKAVRRAMMLNADAARRGALARLYAEEDARLFEAIQEAEKADMKASGVLWPEDEVEINE